ncbi:hypothetical protein SGCZBJ_24840 [Caulobacter zeae]|uniref:Sulfotransferase family protein n=1 Tax=Caulobacter zeae TaxID=2055137 RepID=A0A2N5CYN7_9CAUL|nr:sulfotransferase family 2 domain-containing protein [Caulobacter zeae]PLR18866.1 hypothetical protein SGCZBJ_24840 [Caulobacter zeae]
MLVSHRRRFIYLKTKKTAGTSVEIYFEPACLPEGHAYEEAHLRPTVETSAGVIGQRGSRIVDSWYNHMPAAEVQARLGEAWDAYLKFCCVRNPYDRLVSAFWMLIGPEERQALASVSFDEVRARFARWMTVCHIVDDRAVYEIQGRPVVDMVIRYEALLEDLEAVCEATGVPFEPERLGRYKGESRLRDEPYLDYYDADTLAQANEVYASQFEWFGYARH